MEDKFTVLDLLIEAGFVRSLDDVVQAQRSIQIDLFAPDQHWIGANLDDDASWASGIRYGKRIYKAAPLKLVDSFLGGSNG